MGYYSESFIFGVLPLYNLVFGMAHNSLVLLSLTGKKAVLMVKREAKFTENELDFRSCLINMHNYSIHL